MAKDNSWGMHTEHFPQQELRHLPVFAKELLAGGVAGGVSKTCVAPLERVKILFQTGRMANDSISQTLVRLLREEGLQGWYRGNGASVLRIVPYAAVNFGAYEQFRDVLARRALGSESAQHHIPPVLDLLAGSAAGGAAVLITYPLDLVRTRLAYGAERGLPRGGQDTHSQGSNRISSGAQCTARAQSGEAASISGRSMSSANSRRQPYPSIRSVLIDTARKEGAVGLYRGIGPTLLGIVPYAGLKFYIYQSLKQYYWRLHNPSGSEDLSRRLPVRLMLSFGAIAGVVAQTATYPLDVIRRHMQVHGLREGDGSSAQRPSMRAALSAIVGRKGVRALFAGLSINYLKVVPSTAVGFTIYDAAKHYLDLPQNL